MPFLVRRRIASAVAALALLSLAPVAIAQGRAAAPAPRDLVTRATQALGGEAALRGMRTLTVRFTATAVGLGQEETWASPGRPTVSVGQTQTDYATTRRVTTQESRPAATPSGANQIRQLYTAEYGIAETNGNATAMGRAALNAGLRAMKQTPERLMLFALDNAGAVRSIPPRRYREEEHDGVRIVDGADSIDVYFDRATGRPVLTVVVTDDPVLGDRATETLFGRWTPTNGVLLPRQVDVTANGRQLSTLQVSFAEVNGALEESAFGFDGALVAQARTQAATAPAAPALVVNLVELGPGVYRAEGSTHHTLVVEQGNGLLLVEAPQSAARMRAVLDTLARRFPGRAVTQVVNTHHHYDHSGGVREVMARGIPVVTHSRNVEFVNRVAAAPKTVAPDGLSRGGRRPAVRGVGDTLVIGSGDSRVVLYPITTVHAEGILAAFVPSAGVLFTSDVLNPPANPATTPLNAVGAGELVAFARSRGLTVRTVAGGHGVAMAWADVERAAPR
jgi:glyoxylase-like metal-dependent hydrolase (beta-lactamase superfamily II)